ncbi:MAG: bifunctional aspartate kinase/homoserine dehydrogenase I [Candidatus Harrisonbacteria bacterium]|nr:bifunctional aspartate kinase/homoserine dehydrogenase I [Candidatus Harrisonbacteria bacterium]
MKKFIKILKFGGSSVGSAGRIKNVCGIIRDSALSLPKGNRITIVVSAMQGITDKLLALDFDFVKEKHITVAKELRVLPPTNLLDELENVIKAAKILNNVSPIILDLVTSFGERLSAQLVADYLNKKIPAIAVDARGLIKTNDDFQNAAVDFKKTNLCIKKFFKKLRGIPVVTGFVGSTDRGQTTTLGRGGSDYSASIFGAALGVKVIEIWTDANGIMTADPRVIAEAFTLPEISYEEAFEMAYFGAKIIHPATMLPAIKSRIPILIKNTFNSNHNGTLILKSPKKSDWGLKNITTIGKIALIEVGGANLAGHPGVAERVFGAVAKGKINVILIAQASSERAICFAVNRDDTEKAIAAIGKDFVSEISRKEVFVKKSDGKSVIAVVGDNMRGVPGVAGRIFKALGDNNINIAAIAQGGSERNISCVVAEKDKTAAVAAIHREFFQKDPAIFIVGTGNVGGELIRQLTGNQLKICGIANSEKMVFDHKGINSSNWKKALRQSQDPMNIEKFLEKAKLVSEKRIFVDCTASDSVARRYADIVKSGFHIVTPNKKANVLPMKNYFSLRKALADCAKHFYYDANVGAGLPIIESIKKMMAAGDEINKIEGIFSGTLSYLFNNYNGRQKFSELAQKAKVLGYTEPDPREDLSGKDVGRKLLILSREIGLPAESREVVLENLVKPDAYFESRFQKAKRAGKVLRYVGSIQNGKISASLRELPADHPLANVSGTDNIIAIWSRYYKTPLVIKGAGAGREVTAAAVLSGILKIIQQHG